MAIRDLLLPEFEHEMSSTRRTLERVPEDKLDWRPHPKSGTMGWLAGHIADIPQWTEVAIQQDSFDIAPGGEHMEQPAAPKSRKELLETFDRYVAAARTVLASVEDEALGKTWTLLSGGAQVLAMPRLSVLRNFVLNHIVHHRAQLGVYLRLNDIPVPAIYGPSADESGM